MKEIDITINQYLCKPDEHGQDNVHVKGNICKEKVLEVTMDEEEPRGLRNL